MMKIKKADKSSSAGTEVDSSTNAQVEHVCQPIAKHNVSGSCGSTSASPLLNWIRVTEGLPNDGETVLIWRRSNKPALATFNKETQHGRNLFVVKDVGAHLDFSWVSHWASINKPKS